MAEQPSLDNMLQRLFEDDRNKRTRHSSPRLKGGGLLARGDDLYRIEFKDSLLRRTPGMPEWIRKSQCRIIEN